MMNNTYSMANSILSSKTIINKEATFALNDTINVIHTSLLFINMNFFREFKIKYAKGFRTCCSKQENKEFKIDSQTRYLWKLHLCLSLTLQDDKIETLTNFSHV